MVIDDLKILIDAVAGMEGTVIYVLVGYILYQLLLFAGTTGAVVAILRLFIIKVHNVLITKKTVVNEVKLDDYVLSTDDNHGKIIQAFGLITSRGDYRSSIMHSGDCSFLLDAVNEKIKNDEAGASDSGSPTWYAERD